MPSEGPRRSDQSGRVLFNECKADLLNQLGRQGPAIELIQFWLGIVQIDLAGTTGEKNKNAVPRPWGKVGRTVSQRIRRTDIARRQPVALQERSQRQAADAAG